MGRKLTFWDSQQRQQRTAKAAETILYNTTHIPETKMIFYDDHDLMDFDATIIEVFNNIL
jgi:hypothetical protein